MSLAPWLYHRTITDSTAGSLAGAVCTVALTSANFDFSLANADGSDLRVYDDTAAALVPHWLMDYDSVAQTAAVFYKATLTSHAHSLYYGNSSTSTTSSFAGVFTHGSGFDADWGDLTTRTAGNGTAVQYAGPASPSDPRNYTIWRLAESPALSASDLDNAGVPNPGGIYTGLREFNLVRDTQNRVLKVNGKYYITFMRRPPDASVVIDGWRAESTSKYGPWSNFTQLFTTGTVRVNYPSSCLRVGSTYYLFITYGWAIGGALTPPQVVHLRTSTDLTTWSAPTTVLTAGIFNDVISGACTDNGNPWVCPLADGTYMMVVEAYNSANLVWSCYGATSPDLINWTALNSGNPLIARGGIGTWTQSGVANPKCFQLPDHSFLIQYNGSDVARGTATLSNYDWQIGYATAPAGSPGGPYTPLAANPVIGRANTSYGFEAAHFSWDEDGKSYYDISQRFDTSSATGRAYFLYAEPRQGGLCLTKAEDGTDAAFAGVVLGAGTFTAESHACLTAHRSNNSDPFILALLEGTTVPGAMTSYAGWGLGLAVASHDRADAGDLVAFYYDGSAVRHYWTGSAWSTASPAPRITADHAREIVGTIADDGTNYLLKAHYADDGSSIFSASIAKSSVYGMPTGRVLVAGDTASNAFCSGQFFRRISVRPYVAVEPVLTLGAKQLSAATGYSLTAPAPASGYANNASGFYTITPNGVFTGTITITPTAGFSLVPVSQTWTGGAEAWVFQITPNRAGSITLTPSNSGGLTDLAPLTYTSLAPTLSVGPLALTVSTPTLVTFIGVGTRWRSLAPAFAPSGSAGATVGTATVLSDTSATALVTPGSSPGTLTFTDSTTGALATASVNGPLSASTWSHLSAVTSFGPGLLGSVAFSVLHADGSTYAARSGAGVFTVGSIGYAAPVALPMSGAYLILWDDGAGHESIEVVSPRGVEPSSAALPGGLNQSQAIADIHSVLGGLVSGFLAGGGGHPIFMAPDGTTPRVEGDIDAAGNRTHLTLTPPQ